MKKIIALLAAIATLGVTMPAYAEPGCNGCNIVDSGRFGRSMVGYTVYFEHEVGSYTAVRVMDVDVYSNRVLWQDGGGDRGWSSARNFYTATAKNERMANALAVGGGVVLGALVYCAFNPADC